MKKITLLIVVVLVAMLVSNFNLMATCEFCYAPKQCVVITVPVNYTVSYPPWHIIQNVTFTLCYECSITNPGMTAEIIEIDGLVQGQEDKAWDAAFKWVSDHQAELCGHTPCETGSDHIVYKLPICGGWEYDGNNPPAPNPPTYRMKYQPGGCMVYCIQEWDQCYCNCIPPCDGDPGCPAPHVKLGTITSTMSATPTCDWAPTIVRGVPNSADCARVHTDCNP
ncbi:MAG: hypothetical protein NT007_01375 [Candidatus Kapabacteria bacterium]|nr:hypothetical protein [Candidatus Kapabacteria bacterium]